MNRLISFLLVLAGIGCASAQVANTSDPAASDQVFARQVRQVPIEREDTIPNLFMWSLTTTKTPGGIVLSADLDEQVRLRLKPSTLSLPDVLDSLVVVEPRYHWSVSDGVVNFAPVDNLPLLDIPIVEFKSEKATAQEMIETLQTMPQLLQSSHALGFSNSSGYEYDGPMGETTSSVHCRNTSLREVLNQIVRSNGRAIWRYREYTYDGKKYFQLGLLFST